jgi:hypothetical protein
MDAFFRFVGLNFSPGPTVCAKLLGQKNADHSCISTLLLWEHSFEVTNHNSTLPPCLLSLSSIVIILPGTDTMPNPRLCAATGLCCRKSKRCAMPNECWLHLGAGKVGLQLMLQAVLGTISLFLHCHESASHASHGRQERGSRACQPQCP